MELTQEYLKTCFIYNPLTGLFVWKVRPREHFPTGEPGRRVFNSRFAGIVAGCRKEGYRQIRIAGNNYRAHRLAFLYYHGYMPEFLDHINGERDDNRISNLRPSSKKENGRNQFMSSRNTSGFNGVYWHKRDGKWTAWIGEDGKHLYLGNFDTIIDAVASRIRANREKGFSGRHGEKRTIKFDSFTEVLPPPR